VRMDFLLNGARIRALLKHPLIPVRAENPVLLIWRRNRITSQVNDCVAVLLLQAVGLSVQADKSA
jgi:hypothetical protein